MLNKNLVCPNWANLNKTGRTRVKSISILRPSRSNQFGNLLMEFQTKRIQLISNDPWDPPNTLVDRWILLQGDNGPCFLLAYLNTLLLNRSDKIDLRGLDALVETSRTVPLDSIVCELTNIFLTLPPSAGGTLDQFLEVVPELVKGLDVNLCLDDVNVTDFGNRTVLVNQLLELAAIKVVHGFVGTFPSGLSFDQAQDLLIGGAAYGAVDGAAGTNDQLVAQLQAFFHDNPTQLTDMGLQLLTHDDTVLPNDGYAILFRNDHFTTLSKHNQQLFTLVNDEGYRNETSLVWETLTNVSGDERYLTGTYQAVPDHEPVKDSTIPLTSDELLARQLQEEEDARMCKEIADADKAKADKVKASEASQAKSRRGKHGKRTKSKQQTSSSNQPTSSSQPNPSSTTTPPAPRKSKSDDCTIV